MNALHLPWWFVLFALGFILDFGGAAVVADRGWSQWPVAGGFIAVGVTVSFLISPLVKRYSSEGAH